MQKIQDMSSTSGSNSACYCSPMSEASVIGGTPITTGANANLLADSLGISPLYRQQEFVVVFINNLSH